MHFITLPVTFISFTIGPYVPSEPLDFIDFKITLIDAAVCKVQTTLSMLLALFVLPFVPGTVRPRLYSSPLLLVFHPISRVRRSVCMQILPVAMSFVVAPEAIIDITISMRQFTLAIGFIIFPLSFIFGPIGPLLCSLSVFEAIFPLAAVYDPVF